MSDIKITDYGRPTPPEGEHTWTTEEMQEEFKAIQFQAPFVLVERRADGVRGTLEFTHQPRLYFSFQPTTPRA
jgi:hypothetical protein